jgi:hypothetical protein
MRHYPETDFEAEKRRLQQEERRIDKLLTKAVRREAAGNLAGALEQSPTQLNHLAALTRM